MEILFFNYYEKIIYYGFNGVPVSKSGVLFIFQEEKFSKKLIQINYQNHLQKRWFFAFDFSVNIK